MKGPLRSGAADIGSDGKGHDVAYAVSKRLGRSFRLDEKKVDRFRSDIRDKERAIEEAKKEYRALTINTPVNARKGEMDLQKGMILARVGSLRSGVNRDVMMIYSNMIQTGKYQERTLGNGGFPDLYSSSPVTVALQKLGLPVLDQDLEEICGRDLDRRPVDGMEVQKLLDIFKDQGLFGSWISVEAGASKVETNVRMIGRKDLKKTLEMINWLSDLIETDDASCYFSLTPGGPKDVQLGSMGMKGFITMMPVGAGEMAQIKTKKIRDLAEMWVGSGHSILLNGTKGHINQKKFSLQMLESSHAFDEVPIIRLEDQGEVRDLIVDDISLISGKMVLIDTLKQRGAEKVETHFGREFDRVVKEWGRTGYQMMTFSRSN